jgi:predicted enzyme related to lactoylglutathione lyase
MPIHASHQHGSFCWIDIGATDQAAAREFYAALFGWSYVDVEFGLERPYTLMQRNGQIVCAIYSMSSLHQASNVQPRWTPYVSVGNIEQVLSDAIKCKGKILRPATTVTHAGRVGFIEDPTGVLIGLWQAKSHIGFAVTHEVDAPCWFQLRTRDAAAAERFYEKLFGWTVREEELPLGTQHIASVGGRRIAGIREYTPPMTAAIPGWSVMFESKDTRATLNRGVELGGTIVTPATELPGFGVYGALRDPQGGMFAVLDDRPEYWT